MFPASDLVARALSSFPQAVADAMRQAAVHRRWGDGEVMFHRGERVAYVALLISGRVRIAVASGDGEEIFFRWQLPGEFVGLLSSITQRPFPVDAVAFDHCEALWFDWDSLRCMLETNGVAALSVARIIGEHAGDMTNLIVARTAHSLSDRVRAVLRHLVVLNAVPLRNDERVLAVSQMDIAHAVGASRQRVNIELRKLEKSGQIRLGYRSVIILPKLMPP